MLQFMKKMDKPIKGKIASFFSKTVVKQIIIGIVFTISLYLITVGNIAPEKITVKIGDVAPDDIRATKDIIDENATERLKQEAMDRVESRYRVDTSIQVKVKNEIKKFFEMIKEIQNMEETTLVKKAATLEQQSNIKLTENDYNAAIRLSDESLLTLESNIYEIVTQIMGFGIKEEELEYEKQNVAKNFDNLENLSNDAKTLGISIINLTIRPNWFLDIETTQQKKKEAAEQVPDVVIKEGQIIVEQKQIIDQKAFSLIKKSGLIKEAEGFDYSIIFGTLIIVLIFEMIIIAYLYIFDKKVLYNSKLLLILSIIMLSIIIISKSIYGISGYLVPISTATMLISLLINPKLAILTNLILSVIIGTITSNDLNMIIPLLIGGTAGVFAVINTHQRYNILLTGLLVSGINILIITAFGLIYNLELHELISRCIYGALNGLFSAILTIGSLPLWESLFGILTPLKLLELSNPNQPLLKKLLLEAPGTYHHSIVVGNLSETAAEAVDGSPLLARVGAYYHDVGKLKRPYFFKENQLNGENPHDKINPSLSTLIITNHTKDGVEFAQKYKLPMQIRDIIQQHHGETLVAYFYHKALNGDNANSVKPDTFRYDGPKPQTKEAAIVMLADSVEAAVRAMREPTKGKIEGLVRQIIKDKLNDGQLDECGLTLKDLSTIANSFVNVLMGIFHERIEYPKLDLAELKGGN